MFTKPTFIISTVLLISTKSISAQSLGYEHRPQTWRPVTRIDGSHCVGSSRQVPLQITTLSPSLHSGNTGACRPSLLPNRMCPEPAFYPPITNPISHTSDVGSRILSGSYFCGTSAAQPDPFTRAAVVHGASPWLGEYYMGGNLFGNRTIYHSRQPVRNLFRFVLP